MNLRYLGLVGGLLLSVNAGAEILISNLAIQQREGSRLVDIFYDIAGSEESSVAVFAVISNETSAVNAHSFSGDYGGSVPVGYNRHMIWDGGADLKGIVTSNLTISVKVFGEIASGMTWIPAGINAGLDPDGDYSVSSGNLIMNTTEVNGRDWKAVRIWAESHGYFFANAGVWKLVNHPVVNVDWFDCIIWCNARSEQEGLLPCYKTFNGAVIKSWYSGMPVFVDDEADGYRLPTSEEWEYAARGGLAGLRFPWGDEISHAEANYSGSTLLSYDESGIDGYHPDYQDTTSILTCPVSDFEFHGYGLKNMTGNVWEWCWSSAGSKRCQRGGGWGQTADKATCRYRDYAEPTVNNYFVGFRPVRNLRYSVSKSRTIAFDSRDYELSISSGFGAPVPPAGTSVFAWRSAVSCFVEGVVSVDGTNYTCIGWSGTGSVPATGEATALTVVLDELHSSIDWVWATDDKDRDGLVDDWELLYFGNLDQVADDNFDGDAQDNLSEFIAGTNPTNPASFFRIFGQAEADGFILSWPGVSNRTYRVQWTPNLQYVFFKPFETNVVFPACSVTTDLSRATGFFRVDVHRAP